MEFGWLVSLGGYDVATLKFHSGERRLGPAPVVFAKNSFSGTRQVDLKDHPLLFEAFADLEATEEAVRTFANKYGLLGFEPGIGVPFPKGGKPHLRRGELLSVWEQEITALRIAFKVWELLDRGIDDELGQHLKRGEHDDDVELYNPPGFDGLKFHELIYEDEAPPLDPSDIRTPIRHWLRKHINARLQAHVELRLEEDNQGNLIYGNQPKNVLGAMWYQLSQVVTGVARLNRCLVCGRPIVVKRGGRSDRVYCSDRCKMRASRSGKRVRKQSKTAKTPKTT